jgi:hypothetical protein
MSFRLPSIQLPPLNASDVWARPVNMSKVPLRPRERAGAAQPQPRGRAGATPPRLRGMAGGAPRPCGAGRSNSVAVVRAGMRSSARPPRQANGRALPGERARGWPVATRALGVTLALNLTNHVAFVVVTSIGLSVVVHGQLDNNELRRLCRGPETRHGSRR